MARTVRDTNLEKPATRLRLTARGKPYWRVLESGFHLGYRRAKTGGGSWTVRRFLGEGKYVEKGLGLADDLTDADGVSVHSFRQAQDAARTWWRAKERQARGMEPYTIAMALEAYFADRERRGSKGVRVDRYAAAARIVPLLGAVEVSRLTTGQLREWHEAVASSPKLTRTKMCLHQHATMAINTKDPDKVRARRSTANRLLTILKAALNHAFHESRIASDDGWRRAKPFREVDAPIVHFISEDECRRIVNACQGGFRDLVRAALLTGCRYGELARMRASDFNADAGTITVQISKSGKPRHVALTDEGQGLFAELTAGHVGHAIIFTRDNGEPWGASHPQRPMAAACKRARIEPAATFHILRHTYASALAMRGVPMGVIAAQLGHSDTRVTERHYAHIAPSYVAETVRAALPSLGIVDKSNVASLKHKF